LKTNKISLSLMPSDTEQEENEVLDTITKLTDEQKSKEPVRYPYSLTGTIIKVHNRASAQVQFAIEGEEYIYDAMTTQPLQEYDQNRECMISFNQGRIDQPVITGIIQRQEPEPLVLSSEAGVVLECGDTRIVLDVDGTLDLKALHINSQAYGPYRIKGASVKIN